MSATVSAKDGTGDRHSQESWKTVTEGSLGGR